MHLRRQQSGFVGVVVVVLVILIVISVALVTLSRTHKKVAPKANEIVTQSASRKMKGLSFSPKSFSAADMTDFYAKAKELHGAVTWAGDWQELGKNAGGPQVVFGSAKKYGYTPIAIATTHQDMGNGKVQAIRPLSDEQLRSYEELARGFADAHKPDYMGFGIEVNRIYDSSPSEYQQFVKLFSLTADAIHSVSPHTKVFTTFQLEQLRGLHGGLYGGANDENKNNWQLLNDFAKADVVGFTSYPSLIYHLPSDIPVNYYQSIVEHTSKPIIFSELGWPAGVVAAGWDSSPDAQGQFIDTFAAQISTLNPQVIIWSFLYDPKTAVPFNSMGLIAPDTTARVAWQKYLSM